MEQINRFDKELKLHLNKLPQHKAPIESWGSINDELNFSDELSRNSKLLPNHKAPENAWKEIEQEIAGKPSRQAIPLFYKIASIAAVLILAVTLFIVNNDPKTDAVISYSEETHYSDEYSDKTIEEEPNTVEMLEQQCLAVGNICEKQEIKENIASIKEIELEIENIEKVIESIGSSPALIQTKIKMENLKVKLTKEVLQNLNS